jgi:hypothetical protein
MEHEIKKDGFYSVFEILDYKIVNVSERTLQNYAKKYNIRRIDRSYRFTGHQVIELRSYYENRAKNKAKKLERAERNERLLAEKKASIKDVDLNLEIDATEENKKEEDDDEVTIPMEDFEKLQIIVKQRDVNLNKIEMLVDRVEDYKNEIQYLRESLDKRNDQMDKMLESINSSLASIQQQNFIQAKEKGFDKK